MMNRLLSLFTKAPTTTTTTVTRAEIETTIATNNERYHTKSSTLSDYAFTKSTVQFRLAENRYRDQTYIANGATELRDKRASAYVETLGKLLRLFPDTTFEPKAINTISTRNLPDEIRRVNNRIRLQATA